MRLTAELRIVKSNRRFYLLPVFYDLDGAMIQSDSSEAILSASTLQELIEIIRVLGKGIKAAVKQPVLKF